MNSSSVKTGSLSSGGMPTPSNARPSEVGNCSLGRPNHHCAYLAPGSLRRVTSEQTPWAGWSILVVREGHSSVAWVKVALALTVEPAVRRVIGRVKALRAGAARSGCGPGVRVFFV